MFRHLDAPAHSYSMLRAPLTSMEKTVSKWTLHRTSRLSEPQRELESEWDPGLLRAYIARLFLTTRPSLITEFPPGPLRKHVWLGFLLTHGQIQTESKNDSIDSLQPPPPSSSVGKRRGGVGGGGRQKCFTDKAGTCHGCDIQRAGFSPAPISQNLKQASKKKKKKKKAARIRGNLPPTPLHPHPPPEET